MSHTPDFTDEETGAQRWKGARAYRTGSRRQSWNLKPAISPLSITAPASRTFYFFLGFFFHQAFFYDKHGYQSGGGNGNKRGELLSELRLEKLEVIVTALLRYLCLKGRVLCHQGRAHWQACRARPGVAFLDDTSLAWKLSFVRASELSSPGGAESLQLTHMT